jgi:hypothetical protein
LESEQKANYEAKDCRATLNLVPCPSPETLTKEWEEVMRLADEFIRKYFDVEIFIASMLRTWELPGGSAGCSNVDRV